jgi:maltodextrin utilization protein YvdJ
MKNFDLEKYDKIKPGFEVPEGYFDSFSEKIISKIEIEIPKENPKVISIFERNKKWIFSSAASLIVFFSTSYYFYNSNKQNNETYELEQYIVNQTNLTDDDFANNLSETEIANINIEFQLEQNNTEIIDLETIEIEENL